MRATQKRKGVKKKNAGVFRDIKKEKLLFYQLISFKKTPVTMTI